MLFSFGGRVGFGCSFELYYDIPLWQFQRFTRMFSLRHSQDFRREHRLLLRRCCALLLLTFLFAAPAAWGQSTSRESSSKSTGEGKSSSGGTTKSKKSSGSKSQTGGKSKTGDSSQGKSASKARAEESDSATGERSGTTKAKEAGSSEETPSEKPETSPSPSPSASPTATVSSLKPEDLRGFHNNPPEVQELLTAALELTQRNLGYQYGSADPAQGGMDCSGTIYFLLQKMGMTDVPRSASQQYVWVRRADAFKSVVSTSLDSFELDDLRPGDLLFWTGTYSVNVDPPVTHTMIYLGKARSDGRPLMVGASDGRTFRGEKKNGVSVFDFVIPKPDGKNPMSRFIGYAAIPR